MKALSQASECRLVELVLRAEAIGAVVDRVVTTPQDAAVGGRAVVVELISGIGHARSTLPADPIPLRLGQRLTHQHVVVHRHDVLRDTAQQGWIGIRCQRNTTGAECTGSRGDEHIRSAIAQADDRGVLVDGDTQTFRRCGQAPGQARRIHQCDPRIEHPGEVGGRVHRCAHLLLVQELEILVVAVRELDNMTQLIHLMWLNCGGVLPRHAQISIDTELVHPLEDRGQVLVAQSQEFRHGVGPARCTIGQAMGQGVGHEAAIAA